MPFEQQLATALRSQPPVWTPDCLEPEDLIGLIESGRRYAPGGLEMMAHAAACAHCRQEFAAMERTLQLAKRARELQSPAEHSRQKAPLQATGHAGSQARVHFDWRALTASSSPAPVEAQGVFCDGALRATLWLDGEQVVLTVENDPGGRWRLNERGHACLETGAGASLAGRLVRYDVSRAGGELSGYLVLPPTDGDSAAEVGLGVCEHMGEFVCRLGSPEELTSPEAVDRSIARSRDTDTRGAWETFLSRHTDALTVPVREAIQKALSP